jgi:hypothetical protein
MNITRTGKRLTVGQLEMQGSQGNNYATLLSYCELWFAREDLYVKKGGGKLYSDIGSRLGSIIMGKIKP